VASQTVATLLDARKTSADAGAKMLQYKSLPATASVAEALEAMRKDGISMVLVTKGKTTQDWK
jgi:CBS domain-containing protein